MAKNTLNFTKIALEALPLPMEDTRAIYHDSKTKGLQLRVTSNGVKTFNMFRWVKAEGKPERITLGRFPDMSVEKAREKADIINGAIANKENPNNAIRAEKAEMTFGELFNIYLERWAKPHKKSWQEDVGNYKRHIEGYSKINSRKLSRITKTDIATLHTTLGKEHPTGSNRVLALISSVFGRATEWGLWDKANPTIGIRKFPEKSRDRFIQSDELPVFFEAMSYEPSEQIQDYFMLLLLTGVRRANLLAMRWDEISFERKEWRIPETKNGEPQVISLDDSQGVMVRILENRKAKAKERAKAEAEAHKNDEPSVKGKRREQKISPWVFPGEGKTGHMTAPRKGWERILARAEIFQLIGMIAEAEDWKPERVQQAKDKANGTLEKALAEHREKATKLELEIENVGLQDLRIHDLRRTLGSWMAGTGATSVIIGRQLNHKSPSATAIYSRLQQDPVKEARNKAVTAIFGAAGMTPAAEIVQMQIRKKV